MKRNIIKSFKLSILGSALWLAFSSTGFAAKVPANVSLAKEQAVNLQFESEITSVDPQKSSSSSDALLVGQLFEGLVNVDEEGNLLPGVAERWEASPDNKVWTFHLRHNAKWSNGDPVTAHDFVYTWRRLVDPKTASEYSTYLDFMKLENVMAIVEGKKSPDTLGVKALDDFTLQLTLTHPVPYAVDLLQNASLFPVHQATVEKYGDNWTQPQYIVSNGAYRLESRILNEKINLVRNPHYWNNSETVLDKATYHIVGESAGIARYRAGGLDIAHIPSTLYRDKKFRQEYADQIYNSPKLGTFTYVFNLSKPPFDNIRLRQALTFAMDRTVITDKLLGSGQTPAYTFTPPYTKVANKIKLPDYAQLTQQERNQQAQKWLEEAGYSKQHPLQIELLYNTNEGLKEIAIAASAIWKKNTDGLVDVRLKNLEWKTFLQERNQRRYDLAFSAWIADYNEASTFLNCYLPHNENNIPQFKSELFKQFIDQSYLAKNENERAELYAKAEAELDAHYPFVPIYHYAGLFVKNPKLKGYEGKNPQGTYFLKDFYLEQ